MCRIQSNLVRRVLEAQLLVALLVGLVGLTAPAQMGAVPEIGIKNFGKVNDHYYRGSQPGEAEFAELKRLGVKTIIDLRKNRLEGAEGWAEAKGPYRTFVRIAGAKKVEVQVGAAEFELTEEAMKALREMAARQAPTSFLLHDRTQPRHSPSTTKDLKRAPC